MGRFNEVKNKAVFLDRDGILNKAIIKNGLPYPPRSIDKLIIETNTKYALENLKKLVSKAFKWLDN